MRVCVLGLRGMPNVLGGVETHCAELLPNIAAQMEDVSIEVIARSPYQPPLSFYRGVRVARLWCPRHKQFEALLHTAAGVFFARFARHADLLHIHAIGPALLAPLARALGMRVVVTHHGADYRRAKWKITARTLLRLGEAFAVLCADRVIAVSPSLARDLRLRFPRHAEKIAFIPNGVPSELRMAEPRQVLAGLGLAPGGYILSVGRLVPEKGFDDLIAAFRASGVGAKLVIAGATAHEDAYAASLRAQSDERVVFAGFQRPDALAALYANCALFVLASRHEGMPIAALEALAAQAPVLLSDIEAHRDFGLPPRCYFAVGDRAALSAKLTAPPAELRCADLGSLDAYAWPNIAARTKREYETAMAC